MLRAVYFARHAVVFAWGDTVTSGEVVVALDSAGGVVAGEHDTTAVFHPEKQQQKIGAADQHRVRIETSIRNGYTRRAINWQEDLETTVE